MIRVAMCLAALAAAQSAKEDEKLKYPPFTLVITAKTAGTPDVERQAFEKGLKQLKGLAELLNRVPAPRGDAGYEDFTFEIPGNVKFDPTPFWHTFINVKVRKYRLTMTGTLSQEEKTKKLFITSYSGKTKVKLMNRPKSSFDNPDDKVEDLVGELTKESSDEGKLHFVVTGEIFSSGGTLAILLSSYKGAEPPPKPKEPKK
ncbi:MAG TPA: hypothetical protein VFC90_04840 [Planctomycetota bacterium]|nr:hypothetical protein [Planctomycetota bacterium]